MYKKLTLGEKLIIANEISHANGKGIIFDADDLERVKQLTGQQITYIGGHDITPEYWDKLKKLLFELDDHCLLFNYQMEIPYEEAKYDCIGCTESDDPTDLYAQAITYDDQTSHLIGIKTYKNFRIDSEWDTWNHTFFLAFHPTTLEYFKDLMEAGIKEDGTDENPEINEVLRTVLQYNV